LTQHGISSGSPDVSQRVSKHAPITALLTAVPFAALLLAAGCDNEADQAAKTPPAADNQEEADPDRPQSCVKAEACCVAMAEQSGSDAKQACMIYEMAGDAKTCQEMLEAGAAAARYDGKEPPAECT